MFILWICNLHFTNRRLTVNARLNFESFISDVSLVFQEDDKPPDMPVTHDSIRLIEQARTICEQRIYLDEAKELYSLISSKWLHVSN